MATYTPAQLGIKPPAGGFQQGGWYSSRQYWAGTLSEPNVIHPQSTQVGAGQPVSAEVRAQSAAQQGVSPQQFEQYIQQQAQKAVEVAPTQPVSTAAPTSAPTPAPTSTAAGVASVFEQMKPEVPQLEGLKSQYEGEVKLTDKQKAADDKFAEITAVRDRLKEQEGLINENPFLSEASRVGKIRRLTEMAQKEVENLNLEWAKLQDEVTKANADVTARLNLANGQWQMNQEAYESALSQFNTLLSMGAYDNATANDIAQTTTATGIPSSMIESAIATRKAKNVETAIHWTEDDAGNVTAVVLNQQTGDVISKTSLGQIAKTKATTPSPTKDLQTQFLERAKTAQGKVVAGQWWGVFPLLVAEYAPYYSLQEIYRLYASSETGKKYGTPAENPQEMQELYDYARTGEEPY